MNTVWNIPHVRWPSIWKGYARTLGAAIATIFWEALQLTGTWYVTRQLRQVSATYGFLAVVITR
jgi:uncharacterized BrkB/YihY/UPF0761 family membrane protein